MGLLCSVLFSFWHWPLKLSKIFETIRIHRVVKKCKLPSSVTIMVIGSILIARIVLGGYDFENMAKCCNMLHRNCQKCRALKICHCWYMLWNLPCHRLYHNQLLVYKAYNSLDFQLGLSSVSFTSMAVKLGRVPRFIFVVNWLLSGNI